MKIRLALAGFLFLSQYALAQPNTATLNWAVGTTNSTNNVRVNAIALDAAENLYYAGRFAGTTDFDPGPGVSNVTAADLGSGGDMFIMKMNNNGSVGWVKTFTGTNDEEVLAMDIDAAGNIYATGYFATAALDFDPGAGSAPLTPAGGSDAFILKLDNLGNFVWAKRIGAGSSDQISGLEVHPGGGIVVTGTFLGTINVELNGGPANNRSAQSASQDAFVLRLDADANFIWFHQITGPNGETTTDVDIDGSGNSYVMGRLQGFANFDPGVSDFQLIAGVGGSPDIFLMKLEPDGDFLWADNIVRSVTAAGFASQSLALGVDNAGNAYTFVVSFGDDDLDPGPGTVTITTSTNEGIVSKFNPDGTLAWAKDFETGGGGGEQWGYSLNVDPAGNNILIAAATSSGGDYDPDGTHATDASGNPSTTIVKWTTAGTYVWAGKMGLGNGNFGTQTAQIIPGASGNVYVAGVMSATRDLDPSACVFNVVGSTGTNNSFYAASLSSIATPPVVSIFAPTSGPVGTPVTLTGSAFSADPSDIAVTFNNVATTVSASSLTSITTTVPAGATTGRIRVTIQCVTVQTSNFTVTGATAPTITSFTPGSGPVTTPVTITGTNFSTTPASNTVMFNGTTATVISSTATSIVVNVPNGATTGAITVTVGGNTATSATNFTVTTPLPTITSFTPASGPEGAMVTITGTNFSGTPSNNIVKFNGTTATIINSSPTSLIVSVPVNATTGLITVTVGGNTATSATNFTVTPAGTPTITINEQPESAVVCNDVDATFTASADGTPGITYQWQYSTTSNGVFNDLADGGTYSNTASSTLTVITTSPPVAGFYRCKIDAPSAATVFSSEAELTITVLDCSQTLTVYNAVSPNGDNHNEILFIENIDLPETKKNRMTIYNRWGSLVFEVNDYDNAKNVFKGESNSNKELPSGVYYFKLQFDSNRPSETGYIVLKR